MALGSTEPITEMRAGDISWGIKAADANDNTTFMFQVSRKMGASTSCNTIGL